MKEGQFTDSEIIVMLGENGTGKTTFIRMMAGILQPDSGVTVPQLNISYKPQKISPKSHGTVRMLMHAKIRDAYIHPQFITDVMKPMLIESIFDQEVQNLSGGELQRVALTLCLGKVWGLVILYIVATDLEKSAGEMIETWKSEKMKIHQMWWLPHLVLI